MTVLAHAVLMLAVMELVMQVFVIWSSAIARR
jgi:hypothetical protein